MRAMLTSRRKARIKLALKWILFFVIIVISFSISTSGSSGGPRPLLLIPVVIVISAFENELISGITGAICGFLLDIAMGKLIGTNALLLLAVGAFTSLLFLHLLRKNLINIIVITACTAFIQGIYDFFFYYSIWNSEGYQSVFKIISLPSMAYTVLSAPFVYFTVKFIELKTGEAETVGIEEKDENHSRQ